MRGNASSTALASANCGTTVGLEYDVASTRANPARAKRSINSTFCAVGMNPVSCWSPSRAKHSHSVRSDMVRGVSKIVDFRANQNIIVIHCQLNIAILSSHQTRHVAPKILTQLIVLYRF